MITREELRHVNDLRKRIAQKSDSLQTLEEKATSVRSSLDVGERVQRSRANTQGNVIEDVVDMRKEIEELEAELCERVEEVAKFISTLEDETQREVMRRRYVDGRKWEDVALLCGYEISYVFKKHRKVLKLLD